jgi:hypothetical protein
MIRGLVRRFLEQVESKKPTGKVEFQNIKSVTFYPCTPTAKEARAEIEYVDGRVEVVEVQSVSLEPMTPSPTVLAHAGERAVTFDNPNPILCTMEGSTFTYRETTDLRLRVRCRR